MRNVLMVCLAVLLAGFSFSNQCHADDPAKDLETFMRVKLLYSQKVLEGLTSEDYEMIAVYAQRLSVLSRESQWNVMTSKEYQKRSEHFRAVADALRSSAVRKDLDASTQQYLYLTSSCVECHQFIRKSNR